MKNELVSLLQKASTAPLSELLPDVFTFALSTENNSLGKWVSLEMDGYFDESPRGTKDMEVPEYRTVEGRYSYEEGIVGLSYRLRNENSVDSYRLRYRVAELEELAKKSEIVTIYNPKFGDSVVIGFKFDSSTVNKVLSEIRNGLIRRLHTIQLNPNLLSAGDSSGDSAICGFHPLIVEASKKLFKDGHYQEAISAAYRSLIEAVKSKSGCDKDGADLMQAVFSEKNPILRVSEDSGEQKGYMFMFTGAVMGIRNPRAHKTLPETDAQTALEWLSFASALFRILDESSPRADNEA